MSSAAEAPWEEAAGAVVLVWASVSVLVSAWLPCSSVTTSLCYSCAPKNRSQYVVLLFARLTLGYKCMAEK